MPDERSAVQKPEDVARFFVGPTGDFPDGKLDDADKGELVFAVGHDDQGNVYVEFGEPVAWVAMPRAQAVELARLLLTHAGVKEVKIKL
jgi:hypothetical protein